MLVRRYFLVKRSKVITHAYLRIYFMHLRPSPHDANGDVSHWFSVTSSDLKMAHIGIDVNEKSACYRLTRISAHSIGSGSQAAIRPNLIGLLTGIARRM